MIWGLAYALHIARASPGRTLHVMVVPDQPYMLNLRSGWIDPRGQPHMPDTVCRASLVQAPHAEYSLDQPHILRAVWHWGCHAQHVEPDCDSYCTWHEVLTLGRPCMLDLRLVWVRPTYPMCQIQHANSIWHRHHMQHAPWTHSTHHMHSCCQCKLQAVPSTLQAALRFGPVHALDAVPTGSALPAGSNPQAGLMSLI